MNFKERTYARSSIGEPFSLATETRKPTQLGPSRPPAQHAGRTSELLGQGAPRTFVYQKKGGEKSRGKTQKASAIYAGGFETVLGFPAPFGKSVA